MNNMCSRMNCSIFRAIKHGYLITLIKYCNKSGYQYVIEDTFGIVMPWTKSERKIQQQLNNIDARLCDIIREVRMYPEPVLTNGEINGEIK